MAALDSVVFSRSMGPATFCHSGLSVHASVQTIALDLADSHIGNVLLLVLVYDVFSQITSLISWCLFPEEVIKQMYLNLI